MGPGDINVWISTWVGMPTVDVLWKAKSGATGYNPRVRPGKQRLTGPACPYRPVSYRR